MDVWRREQPLRVKGDVITYDLNAGHIALVNKVGQSNMESSKEAL